MCELGRTNTHRIGAGSATSATGGAGASGSGDGYEPYETVAKALGLVHAGCFAHVRRRFDEARKAQPKDNASGGQARVALDFISALYLTERPLWDRDQPISLERRVQIRTELFKPIVEKFHARLGALAPQDERGPLDVGLQRQASNQTVRLGFKVERGNSGLRWLREMTSGAGREEEHRC